MDRQMKTVKEAIDEKDLQRAHRNLINLADNNEELMQEIRWIKREPPCNLFDQLSGAFKVPYIQLFNRATYGISKCHCCSNIHI